MKNNKIKLIIAAVILLIIIGIGALVYVNRVPKPAGDTPVIVTVKKAYLGSIAKVDLTDIGKEKFKDAALYRLYYEEEELTFYNSQFGQEQTILPARKPGDKVKVKLFDAKGNEIVVIETVFVKEK